jgi:hypothetical protein
LYAQLSQEIGWLDIAWLSLTEAGLERKLPNLVSIKPSAEEHFYSIRCWFHPGLLSWNVI